MALYLALLGALIAADILASWLLVHRLSHDVDGQLAAMEREIERVRLAGQSPAAHIQLTYAQHGLPLAVVTVHEYQHYLTVAQKPAAMVQLPRSQWGWSSQELAAVHERIAADRITVQRTEIRLVELMLDLIALQVLAGVLACPLMAWWRWNLRKQAGSA